VFNAQKIWALRHFESGFLGRKSCLLNSVLEFDLDEGDVVRVTLAVLEE